MFTNKKCFDKNNNALLQFQKLKMWEKCSNTWKKMHEKNTLGSACDYNRQVILFGHSMQQQVQ